MYVVGLQTNVFAAETKAVSWNASRICDRIEATAKAHDLPRAVFARLIWTESHFDIKALSPKGAQGIAQFMPATAKERGLSDPYDPAKAIPASASASLLSDLKGQYYNFDLSAAACNAGPGRVSRWPHRKSGLPFETQDYIAAITGNLADSFRKPGSNFSDKLLSKRENFAKACRDLPIMKTRYRGFTGPRTPWGVQVAGNVSQARAIRSLTRVRTRLSIVVSEAKPALYQQRTPRGMKSKWTVRLGTQTRIGATRLYNRIRRVGGF